MAGRSSLLGGIAIWTTALSHAQAQSLAFTQPAADALTALGLNEKYESGQSVQVAWTTPFESTSLVVFQGPLDDGSYNQESVASNLPSETTSTTWTAGVINGASNASALHFQLQNADDATCNGCSVNSLNFYILEQAVSSTATSSSTSSSGTSTMRTSNTKTSASPTSSSTSAVGAAAGSSATSSATLSSDSSNNHSHRALDLGLGIGLGVGIPLLLALFGLCALFALRRRRKLRQRQTQLPRGQRPQSMARNMAQVTERASDSPLVPTQPFAQTQRNSSATNRPRSSYAPSRFSTAGSRASSYFEPFEFEQPGSQDFDTRSVMSAVSASGSRVASRQGLQRINEDEMPTTPQWPLPAHRL